jgi:nicotinamide mononucleotide transporter
MVANWLSENYIEVLGAVTGLIYLYFSIRQIIWLWPLGIVTSVLYVFVFFHARFYADMSLQVYYFFISFYGWYHWKFGRKRRDSDSQIPVSRINISMWILLILISFLLTAISGYFLDNYTDSPMPYLDAFTTASSVVATWMLARKMIENWLFWIVIDAVSMGMYIYKGLYPTVILFLVYTFMAVIGYRQWKMNLKTA